MASTRQAEVELSELDVLEATATHYGDNVAVALHDGKVIIFIDPTENQGPSSTGRNYTIGSTRGNVVVDKESGCTVTLTAYRKPRDAAERQELAEYRKSLEA